MSFVYVRQEEVGHFHEPKSKRALKFLFVFFSLHPAHLDVYLGLLNCQKLLHILFQTSPSVLSVNFHVDLHKIR